MTVRWSELGELQQNYKEDELRQPVRVVIDSQNRLTPDLDFFKVNSPILIIRTLNDRPLENIVEWPHFVEQVQLPSLKSGASAGKVDLTQLLMMLAERGLNNVLVESGANLAGAFIEQDLADELILYQAPTLMGGDGKNLVEMPNVIALSETKSLTMTDVRLVGRDIRITATLTKTPKLEK
jgi:diaminohydroxyphosphoribosylaminopyrimidine deaminase/5-amino-6-(5-phosphoribosylamino)uracil reductase